MNIPTLDYRPPEPRKWKKTTRAVWIMTGCVVAFAVAYACLPPTMGRARPPANRVKCATNMKQIGMAIVLYANENGGVVAPDLGALLATQDLVPEVFTCPQSPEERAPGTQPAEWLKGMAGGKHLSYIYVRNEGQLSALPPDAVLMYEPISNHADPYHGTNVLFADGHVEWVDEAEAMTIEAQQRMGVRPVLYPPR